MTTTSYAPAQPAEQPPHSDDTGGLVVKIARWSARHRWLAILIWIAVVAGAVFAGGAVGTHEGSDAEQAVGESAAAERALDRAEWPDEALSESVLVQSRDGGVVDPSAPIVQRLQEDLAALPGATEVSDPIRSKDGTAVLLDVDIASDDEGSPQAEAAADAVARVVDDAAAASPGLSIDQAGDVTVDEAVSQIYDDDLHRAEMISLPVTLAILVIAFGALLAASVPVLLALSAVVAAMGLSQLASHIVPGDEVVSSVILLVGLAVGVDYSLFYIRREREERAKGHGTYDAIAVAAATAGRAVLISGVTVTIAMAGLLIAGDTTFASIGVGCILVVTMAVVGSVTVLPALLALFGRWIDRPRVPLVWRLRSRDGSPRFWSAVLRPVLARPAISFAIAAAALLALAAPALGMRLGDPGVDDLPQDKPVIATYTHMVELFPSEGSTHQVVIWSDDGQPLDRTAINAAVDDLSAGVAQDPAFELDKPLAADYSRDGDVATVDVPTGYDYSSPQAVDGLDTLRDDLVPATLGSVADTDTGVTGDTAWTADFKDLLAQRMPLVVGFVLVLTVVVFVLAFRSLTIALTAVVLNLLSVAAAYGLLTLVFQHTWAEGLLGFHSSGAILTWLPLFLFVILFGLSMDYHVFVVSRIREARLAGLTTRDAVAQGITRSAGTVTSAAVVMVAVFSIFAMLSALDFKQMGVGLASAILIDATVVRAVLLPSAMALLGERNWYLPRWLHRLPTLR
ncbi:MAG TPA: MMPL family transporter [Nocardioidaceae bacterium]|nr:MMPL family transporter [Nocardioidaceae bacterium]